MGKKLHLNFGLFDPLLNLGIILVKFLSEFLKFSLGPHM